MSTTRKTRGRKALCPYCSGSNTHRKGARRTATLGDRPLRYCRDCRRKFTLQRSGEIRAAPARANPGVEETTMATSTTASHDLQN